MADIPQFPQQLPGELWGVTACFSPCPVPIQLENLRYFAEGVRRQGLKLLIVELAYDDLPYQVPDNLAERVVRLRTGAVLWQKERLLNVGIAHLPPTCDKVAWLDGDLLFENEMWVAETAARLEHAVAVQPFETACWLPRGARTLADDLPRGFGEGKCLPGVVAGIATYTTPERRRRALANYLLSGHTGFAWAARRSLLTAHGLYDRDVVGGADVAIAHALLGNEDFWQGNNFYCRHLTVGAMADIAQWSRAVDQDARGNVAFTPGRVLHLWHGDIASRNYIARLQILKDYAYQPGQDVCVDEQGCWQWCSAKPDFHQAVRAYFLARSQAAQPEPVDGAATR